MKKSTCLFIMGLVKDNEVCYLLTQSALSPMEITKMAKLINGIMIGRPARTPEQVEADFEARYVKRGPNDCWEWIGTIEKGGYGVLQIEKKQWRAHRYAYVRLHGAIPDNLLVCHRCNNPLCVNPAHLYVGTSQDNSNDTAAAGSLKGTRNGRAKITAEDVVKIRELYAYEDRSQHWLAQRYGLKQTHISEIVTGKQWVHVGGPIKGKM